MTNSLIRSLTASRGRQTFAELMKKTEVELFDFGQASGGIEMGKSPVRNDDEDESS